MKLIVIMSSQLGLDGLSQMSAGGLPSASKHPRVQRARQADGRLRQISEGWQSLGQPIVREPSSEQLGGKHRIGESAGRGTKALLVARFRFR